MRQIARSAKTEARWVFIEILRSWLRWLVQDGPPSPSLLSWTGSEVNPATAKGAARSRNCERIVSGQAHFSLAARPLPGNGRVLLPRSDETLQPRLSKETHDQKFPSAARHDFAPAIDKVGEIPPVSRFLERFSKRTTRNLATVTLEIFGTRIRMALIGGNTGFDNNVAERMPWRFAQGLGETL